MITPADLWAALWGGFLPALFFIAAGCVLVYLPARWLGLTDAPPAAIIVCLGVLGGVSGLLAGGSREPIMAAMLPAMLTFISGILAYLFGRDEMKEWLLALPFAILAFTLNAYFGVLVGSILRGKNEGYQREYQEWLMQYTNELAVEKELQIRGGRVEARPEIPRGEAPVPTPVR